MNKNGSFQHLSDLLHKLLQRSRDEEMTIGHFINEVKPNSQALISLIFALASVVFFSLPGSSIAFGMVVFFLGLRMALGKGFWLPKHFRKMKIGGKRFCKIFNIVCKIIRWLEKLTRVNRLQGVFQWPGNRAVYGSILAICGLLMALPLPPGTGVPPATATAALSMGLLTKDGLWILIGVFLFLCNLAFFFAIFLLGKQLF